MSNKVLITNSQKAVKVPSGLRILIRCASCPVGERVIAISAIYMARLMPSMLDEMP